MARAWFINGESLVMVRGNALAPYNISDSSGAQLGLSEGPISVRPNFVHKDIHVDAFGGEIPADVQTMLADVTISMRLVNVDRDVLDTCLLQSMGNLGGTIGQVPRAGTVLGGTGSAGAGSTQTRFGSNWQYIVLGIRSPVASKPWRFPAAYMTGPPMEFPLGTEKSIIQVNWRAIPWAADPWGGGTGAAGAILWDYEAMNAAFATQF